MWGEGRLGMGGSVHAHVIRGRRRPPLPLWRRAWLWLKGRLGWR